MLKTKIDFYYTIKSGDLKVGRIYFDLVRDRIIDIKHKIEGVTGISIDNQMLFIRGKEIFEEDNEVMLKKLQDIEFWLWYKKTTDFQVTYKEKEKGEGILIHIQHYIKKNKPPYSIYIPDLNTTTFLRFKELLKAKYFKKSIDNYYILLLGEKIISRYYDNFSLKKLFKLFPRMIYFKIVRSDYFRVRMLNAHFGVKKYLVGFHLKDTIFTLKKRIEETINIKLVDKSLYYGKQKKKLLHLNMIMNIL